MVALAILLAIAPSQDTLRYTFEIKVEQDIDASAAGQGSMQNTMSTSGRFFVVLSDSAAGQVARIVVDSATFGSDNPALPAEMLRMPKNLAFQAYVVDGRIHGSPTPPAEMSIGAVQAMGIAGLLFVPPRKDATVGTEWSDTVVIDTLTSMGRVSSRTVTLWRVTARDGNDLTLEGTQTGATSGDMGGGAMTAKVAGTLRVVTPESGPVREHGSKGTTEMSMAMGDMIATVRQVQTMSITRIE